jgi:hypothetical protein
MGRDRRVIDKEINSIEMPWEFYAGIRVENFIKRELKKRVGWLHVEGEAGKQGSFLYGFYDHDHYLAWLNDKVYGNPIFKIDLAYLDDFNFSYELVLETISDTDVTYTYGYRPDVQFKCYLIATDNNTGNQYYMDNRDCKFIVTRSSDNSTYYEVYNEVKKTTPHDASTYVTVRFPDIESEDTVTYTYHARIEWRGISSNILTFTYHINPRILLKPSKMSYDFTPTPGLYLISYYVGGEGLNKKLIVGLSAGDGVNVESRTYDLGTQAYINEPFTRNDIYTNFPAWDDNRAYASASLYINDVLERTIYHDYHYGYRINSCVQQYPVTGELPYIINGRSTYLTDVIMYYYQSSSSAKIHIDVFDDSNKTHNIYSDVIDGATQNTWYQVYLNINDNMTENRKQIWIQFSLSGGYNPIDDYDAVADPLVLTTYLVKPLSE